ncbi:MAG TPA: fibronectin type III domain-containing protein [Bacteroidia bacterium]|nr:fibronectin type III domain-containing protein [Bacteroidia bacterium]
MSIAVLKLRRKTIPVIVETVRKVVTMMTGNLSFTTPNPPLASITAQVDILDTLDQETQQGGKDKNALKKLAKDKLFGMMTALTSYVQTTTLGDEDQILSAGFELKRRPVRLGMLLPPENVRAAFGLHPGEIILRWAGVYGRLEYFAQVSTNPVNADSWADVPGGHTGRNRLAVSGLTPGQVYYFRIFTECAAGTTGPSEIANHMAA